MQTLTHTQKTQRDRGNSPLVFAVLGIPGSAFVGRKPAMESASAPTQTVVRNDKTCMHSTDTRDTDREKA